MSYQIMKRHRRILNPYYEVKEANLKSYVLYDSNYITLWKRKNYRDNKKISGFPGHGGERDQQPEHRGFLGQ